MARAATALAFCLACAPAQADVAGLELAWRTWMKENNSGGSTLAIIENGREMGAWGHVIPADRVLPLASLSKTITGACVLDLIDDGILALDTPMAQIFASRPDLLPKDAEAAGRITISQLLTHTSGLHDDPTQSIFYPAWWGGYDGPDPVTAEAFEQRISSSLFFYNNLNYAVLGSAIAERTGRPPAEVCSERVLARLETPEPSAIYGTTLSYAGWAMSAMDYARFADGLELSPDWPTAFVERGLRYGPGIEIEEWGEGTVLYHSGSYCLIGARTTGSFFAKLPNGITFALVHDLCLTGDEFWDMFDVLIGAGLR